MHKLPDRLCWRTVQLFLYAGYAEKEGELDSIEDMAWILRIDEDVLETDMVELASAGILTQDDGVWHVKNFAERQAKIPKAEYNRRRREEAVKDRYYQSGDQSGDQSVTNGNTDKIRKDKIREEENVAAVFSAYENSIGVISPTIKDKLLDLLEEYPADWIVEAFERAATRNKRSLGYAAGILRNWGERGKDDARKVETAKDKEARKRTEQAKAEGLI